MIDMIGDRLKELRTGAGMTQPAFGAIAGTSKQYVNRLESGLNKDPNPNFIQAWAKHFHVRMEWITNGVLPKDAASDSPSQLVSLTGAMLLAAIETARNTAALLGSDSFDVLDPDDADMVAEALYELMSGKASTVPDSANPKFKRALEANDGKQARTRKAGGAGGGAGKAKAGTESRTASGRGRKSAARTA